MLERLVKMGCLEGKLNEISITVDLSPQEAALKESESKLDFSSKSSKMIIQALKSENSDGSLSLAQLRRALRELEIDSEVVTDPESSLYKLIKPLKTPKKLYDTKLLSVAAILLGTGPLNEKASWLFRQYDADAQESLDSSEVTNMVNDLIHVAVKAIPATYTSGAMSSDEIQEYLNQIKNSKDKIIEELTQMVVSEGTIGEGDFIFKMSDTNSKCCHLLWSVSLRLLCSSFITS